MGRFQCLDSLLFDDRVAGSMATIKIRVPETCLVLSSDDELCGCR